MNKETKTSKQQHPPYTAASRAASACLMMGKASLISCSVIISFASRYNFPQADGVKNKQGE